LIGQIKYMQMFPMLVNMTVALINLGCRGMKAKMFVFLKYTARYLKNTISLIITMNQ